MGIRKQVKKGKTYYALYAGNKFVKHIGNAAAYRKYLKDIGRKENELATLRGTLTQPAMPASVFDVIYADPPWQYDFAETDSRAIENQYSCMPLNQIKRLRKYIPAAENAVLFLWAPAPKLREALEVLGAWGFTYRTNAIWDKEKIGMGYWFRGQHELLLVGVKGEFSPPDAEARYSSVIREARTNHSKKPECVYTMIEAMFPGQRYIELFGRGEARGGWESWGLEVIRRSKNGTEKSNTRGL